METANDSGMRHSAITSALNEEIERQAHSGANRIDVDALAQAVEEVIEPGPSPAGQPEEGKRPSELNSTNDD